MDISIIFVNYKTNNLLYDAILSIKKESSNISYEIIVVDNSEDDTIYEDLVNNSSKFNYKLIRSKTNLGVGNGGNLGAKFAHGKYLLFLNTDIIFINNALKELYDYIDTHNNVGIVGGNLYNKNLTPNLSFINDDFNKWLLKKHFSYILWLLSKLKKQQDTFNFSNNPLEIKRMIIGAVLMISKFDFEFIGGFDKDIFMYGEESLLCYRVKNELHKLIVNIPTAKIIHLDGGSYSGANETREKARVTGDFIYLSKSLGKEKAILYYKNLAKILKLKMFFAKLKKDKKNFELYKLQRKIYIQKVDIEESLK